jgi:hypothetical protein
MAIILNQREWKSLPENAGSQSCQQAIQSSHHGPEPKCQNCKMKSVRKLPAFSKTVSYAYLHFR